MFYREIILKFQGKSSGKYFICFTFNLIYNTGVFKQKNANRKILNLRREKDYYRRGFLAILQNVK